MPAGFSAHIVGGLQSLHRKISAASKAAEKAALDALIATAYKTQGNAVRLIHSGPKSGHHYGKHQASAPGEPPASDTGALARSIKVKYDRGAGTASVVAYAPYAYWLEFGTTKMAPRPFMGVGFMMAKAEIPQLVRVKWRENFKG